MENSNEIEMQSDYTFPWTPYLLGEGKGSMEGAGSPSAK